MKLFVQERLYHSSNDQELIKKDNAMWAILITVVIVLLILSQTSFEIRTDIEIDASISKVWNAIIDFESYKNWNSQLMFLGGQVQKNGQLHLKLAVPGTKPYEFKPIVSHLEVNKRFAWLAITGMPGIFDGEHFFELREVNNGKTIVTNREVYKGVLSQLFRHLPMMKAAPEGFVNMNIAFKHYIENQLSN